MQGCTSRHQQALAGCFIVSLEPNSIRQQSVPCLLVWVSWFQAGDHTGACLTAQLWRVFCPANLLAGIPADILDSYPVIKEFRNSIASLPEVAAFYE
jgi:hypothetical protein